MKRLYCLETGPTVYSGFIIFFKGSCSFSVYTKHRNIVCSYGITVLKLHFTDKQRSAQDYCSVLRKWLNLIVTRAETRNYLRLINNLSWLIYNSVYITLRISSEHQSQLPTAQSVIADMSVWFVQPIVKKTSKQIWFTLLEKEQNMWAHVKQILTWELKFCFLYLI